MLSRTRTHPSGVCAGAVRLQCCLRPGSQLEKSRESKRAVVIWRLAQERRNGLRWHGGLTAKGKGARAGFLHDHTHLAALAACIQASSANS